MSHATDDPLDPVARLHVLAAALPGAIVAERIVPSPFERVWRVVSDLESMVPRYERNVNGVEVIERRGDTTRIVATLRTGAREEMDVRITPGWCLMQSETTIVCFGARSAGHHTIVAHLEHFRPSLLRPGMPPPPEAREKLLRELDTIGLLASGGAID